MEVIDRILKRTVESDSGCIEWTGALHHGYGWFRLPGVRKSATTHRAMWEAVHGPLPSHLYVCHKCDNRRCVNIEHLFVGTLQENLADMRRKGRHVKGERVGGAKLSEDQVAQIRSRYKAGETQRALAAEFGMHQSSLSLLISGKNWKHVEQGRRIEW